jgi:hypothetical protein|eukprot:SAG11_NODE_33_length_22289_cov_12.857999_10_plen_184_part_00
MLNLSLIKKFLQYTKKGDFKSWVKKNRNYVLTVDDYIKDVGTTVLYKDNRYLLTRTDDAQSNASATIPSELCIAFKDDKEINFTNPINKFLKNFFIYHIHIIENCKKMHQTELLGIGVFKIKKENRPNIRWWPPLQGTGDEDIYYTDLKKCIQKENMNPEFLNLPTELWGRFYKDIETQRNEL